MARHLISLGDPGLFGNEAAEDESEDVFSSYVLKKPETSNFTDVGHRIRVTRAYKGEGKSALLRLTKILIQQQTTPPLLVVRTAAELAPTLSSRDWSAWIRGWKAGLFRHIAGEIGAKIGFAWRDDEMALVEEAEKNGFRQRSVVSAIIERLNASVSAGGVTAQVQTKRPGTGNVAEAIVARWVRGRSEIWLIVDDVDQAFQNTQNEKIKVASFFVACRELCNKVPELRVRAAVRPNVWTTLKMEFEPLSHVEQYMDDLSWTEDSTRQLLSRRIEGYLRRTGQWDSVVHNLGGSPEHREETLIALAFESEMAWGKRSKPPHMVLYTLSKHRPRWMVEMCRIAASHAVSRGGDRITLTDVVADLGEFGRRRIQDLIAEFRSQCAEVGELVSAFNRGPEQFTTDELVAIIDRKILTHLSPNIAGIAGKARAFDVAGFLFEAGFLFGRRDYPDGSYDHIGFSERPSLLRSRADIDSGLAWEIHPVFRQALEIRDSSGREVQRSGDRRGRGRG